MTNQTARAFAEFVSSGVPLIQVFESNEGLQPRYSFSFDVEPTEQNPSGVYQGHGFKKPSTCIMAAQSAYSQFKPLPKKGGWR